MGTPRGAKRDFEALEQRRMRAASLLSQGWRQSDVAREVGASREAVSRWAAALSASGPAALRRASRAGRKPRLSVAELEVLEGILKRGPEALGYATSLWTLKRVRGVIETEFGVSFHLSQIWRILRQLGWSSQLPAKRAVERDEEAIRSWKQERWPRVKKTPGAKAEPSSSSTKADSASDLTGVVPGHLGDKLRSSSTTSTGRRSRRSQA